MKKIILLLIVVAFISFIYTQYKNSLENNMAPVGESGVSKNTSVETLNTITDLNYQLDVEKTSIIWTGETILKSHTGTVDVESVSIIEDADLLSGSISVDMKTITGDAGEGLDGHLKSSDFFDVDVYGQSYLEFTEVSSGNFNAVLTIRDISHDISFVAKRDVIDGITILSTDLVFDRTLYGVNYKSSKLTDVIKDNAIKDNIKLDIELAIIKK